MTESTNPQTSNDTGITARVLRGSPSFANACLLTATAMALSQYAMGMYSSPDYKKSQLSEQAAPSSSVMIAGAIMSNSNNANEQHAAFARTPLAATPSAAKAEKFFSNATPKTLTPEQSKTLDYGLLPPVKTTIIANGIKETHWTLHPFDLVRLAREASQETRKATGIHVPPEKIGAVILAESAGVSRVGWSANGKTPSFGLGQLEENTAKSLGVKNMDDPKENASAIGRLLAEGMRFANAHRNIDPRYTISLAYNTSSSLRNSLVQAHGAGLSLEHLPTPTQHHVKNMAFGENRMKLFVKLSDQHDKQEALINKKGGDGADNPTPSTKSLIAGTAPSTNQERLVNNQVALEKSGHIQRVPMTEQGYADMRIAINNHNQKYGESQNSMSDVAAAKTAALYAASAPKQATDLSPQNLARSLLMTAQRLKDMLFSPGADGSKLAPSSSSPAAPNSRISQAGLSIAADSTQTWFKNAAETIQNRRDASLLLDRYNAPRPT